MSTTKQPLNYLFSAFFADGAIISQEQDDASKTQEGKSAFTDVLEKSKESELEQFSLVGRTEESDIVIIIDLNRGRFYFNGIDVSLEDRDYPLTNRKVIYFREVLQHTTANEGTQPAYVNRTFVGYEGKDSKGRVIKRIINLNG